MSADRHRTRRAARALMAITALTAVPARPGKRRTTAATDPVSAMPPPTPSASQP